MAKTATDRDGPRRNRHRVAEHAGGEGPRRGRAHPRAAGGKHGAPPADRGAGGAARRHHHRRRGRALGRGAPGDPRPGRAAGRAPGRAGGAVEPQEALRPLCRGNPQGSRLRRQPQVADHPQELLADDLAGVVGGEPAAAVLAEPLAGGRVVEQLLDRRAPTRSGACRRPGSPLPAGPRSRPPPRGSRPPARRPPRPPGP